MFAWKGETEEEYEWCLEQQVLKDGVPWNANMILDDGGDLTALLHEKYPQVLEAVHGITEETTTGVHRLYEMLENGELKVPAINVNDSVTKSKCDNKYGCRHSLNDAIKRATDHLLSGKKAVVVGYGDVGKGSAQSLRQEGMIVKVTECDPICAMQACLDGFEVVSTYNDGDPSKGVNAHLLANTDMLVTSTGNYNVCGSDILGALKSGAWSVILATLIMKSIPLSCAATGSGMRSSLRSQRSIATVPAMTIYCCCRGRLVNLGNATGHPSRIMDGSFANQVLAQIDLYTQQFAYTGRCDQS